MSYLIDVKGKVFSIDYYYKSMLNMKGMMTESVFNVWLEHDDKDYEPEKKLYMG